MERNQTRRVVSKYKNVYSSSTAKTLYTNVRVDSICPTRIRGSLSYLAYPQANSTGLAILGQPVNSETVKIEPSPALVLSHGKPIQEFRFSPHNCKIIASSCRSDGMVRIWNLPDVAKSPLDPGWGTEIDIPSAFLAGHERKVDWIQFHPTCDDIIGTASSDGTMRIWSVVEFEDRIVLNAPNESTIVDGAWDHTGNNLWTANSDATLALFDPRASPNPVSLFASNQLATKGCRVEWLHPDPIVISSGFKSQTERCIHVYDTRKTSEPLQELILEGSGVGLLQPIWDPSLPLLYLVSRGEGIRVLELSGLSLNYLNNLKVDKQAVTENDPRQPWTSYPNSSVRLKNVKSQDWFGLDASIELTSIHVPRVNGETVFQEDLYPPLSTHNPSIPSRDWFSNTVTVIEPCMIEFLDAVRDAFPSMSEPRMASLSISKKETVVRPRASTLSKPRVSQVRSNTLPRSSTKQLKPTHFKGFSHASTSQDEEEDEIKDVSWSMIAELEKRGWLGSIWEPRYLLLKNDRFYLGQDQTQDSILTEMRIATFTKFEKVQVGDLSGFRFETSTPYQFRVSDSKVCDQWVTHISSQLKPIDIHSASKSTPLLNDPRLSTASRSNPILSASGSSSHVGPRSRLMSPLAFYTKEPRVEWAPRLAVLNDDGLLHLFPDDLKSFSSGQPPLMTLNMALVLCVRPSPSNPMVILMTTESKMYHFKARNAVQASDWVHSIKQTVTDSNLVPACEVVSDPFMEAPCTVECSGMDTTQVREWQSVHLKSVWVSFVNGSFLYFGSDLAFGPLKTLKVDEKMGLDLETRDGSVIVVCTIGSLVIRHVFKNEFKDGWNSVIQYAKRSSIHWMPLFGFTNESLTSSLESFKFHEFGLKLDSPLIQFMDHAKMNKGELISLYRVTGKPGSLKMDTVPPNMVSLCPEASFVLDTGSVIYHWHANGSSRIGQAQALEIAGGIRKSRSNRPTVVLVEHDEPRLLQLFASALGTTVDVLLSFHVGSLPVMDSGIDIKLFRIRCSIGYQKRLELLFEGIQQSPSKTLLESDRVYILWNLSKEVFLWIGKDSSSEDKKFGGTLAHSLANQISNNKHFVSLWLANEGSEPMLFKVKFCDYEGMLPIQLQREEIAGNIVRDVVQKPIDIPSLFVSIPDEEPRHNGVGRLTFYRIESFEKELMMIPEVFDGYGVFHVKDSLIVLFMHRPPLSGVDKCVSYFWQGSQSTITEKGTSALLTIEMTAGLKDLGEIVHVRVTEGKEPPDFFKMFERGILLRQFSFKDALSLIPQEGVSVLDVRTRRGKAKAIEVSLDQGSFTSNHSFVALSSTCVVWSGKNSQNDELEFIKHLLERFDCKRVIYWKETIPHPEALEVWKSLGLPNPPSRPTSLSFFEARLFNCSGATGVVEVTEVPCFVQEDLDPNSCFFLDAKQFLFAWFGPNAKPNEKRITLETIGSYLKQSTIHDPKRTLCAVTYAYHEPPEFTSHFHGWTRQKFPIDKRQTSIKTRELELVLAEFTKETYTLEELMNPLDHLDRTKLEMYLTPLEFESRFKMSKEAYGELQPWKREKLRKAAGFF